MARIDHTAIQIGALHEFLAHVPRDRRISLSAQILRDAETNEFARRVVASKVFVTPADTVRASFEASASIPSVALTGKRIDRRFRPKSRSREPYYG